jgi:hypothetical protein
MRGSTGIPVRITSAVAGVWAIAAIVGVLACGKPEDRDAASIPPLDVARVTAGTTEFQRGILADGVVRFAEYERATLATISCIKEAGMEVTGPYPRSADKRFLEFNYGMPASAADTSDARVMGIGQECEREYRVDVARVWEYQHLLTPEQREDMRQSVIGCLNDGALAIDENASVKEVYEAMRRHSRNPVVERCRERFADFFVVGVK